MNKERRQELYDVSAYLDEAIDVLSEIRDEEQESFDNLPDGLQTSRTGDSIQDAIQWMDGIEQSIGDIRDKICAYAKNGK